MYAKQVACMCYQLFIMLQGCIGLVNLTYSLILLSVIKIFQWAFKFRTRQINVETSQSPAQFYQIPKVWDGKPETILMNICIKL